MKKSWKTPELSRFGTVAQMTLASEHPNNGKCPGLEDDAECAPSGHVGKCKDLDPNPCSGFDVFS